jgi:hypothetical protein
MKEHSVSQLIAPPTNVHITYDSLANEMMTGLARRVQQGIDIVINEAAKHNVQMKEIWVAGFESYEGPTREIWVNVEADATDDAASELHRVLATAFARINKTSPNKDDSFDVTVQIAVNW